MHRDYRTKLAARGWHVSFLDNPTGPSVPAIYRTGFVMEAQPIAPFLERVSLGHFAGDTPLLDAESVMLDVALGEGLAELAEDGTPSLTKRGWATIGGVPKTVEVKFSAEGLKSVVDEALEGLMHGCVARALTVATEALKAQANWPNVPPEDPRKVAAQAALGCIAYGIADAMEAA